MRSGFGLFKALAPIGSAIRATWKTGVLRLFSRVGLSIVSLFWLVVRWGRSLRWRYFLQGLPALTAVIAIAVFSMMAMFTRVQALESRYLEQARSATRAKNYADALACYERLSQLHHDRSDILYDMALVADAVGQSDRCRLLMEQLAPTDKLGYAKAHLWTAVRLFSRGANRSQLQLAKIQLQQALDAGLEDKESAHGLLGELLMNEGQYEDAETHLLIAVKTKPNARLRLARLYAMKGDRERAKTEAKLAANMYSSAVKSDPNAHAARFKWAESLVFTEDFSQAIAILEEGYLRSKEETYRQTVAGVCTSWFDFLTIKGNPNPGLRMLVLERGLQEDPKNLGLLNRLLFVTGIKREMFASPNAVVTALGWGASLPGAQLAAVLSANQAVEVAGARATLRTLAAKGTITAPIHFALGVAAWEEGHLKEAKVHWQRAYELAPGTPALANNLAWLLYQTDPNKLDKALELVNIAIAKMPNETNFFDTRGYILMKMEKYPEALRDLEAALPRSPNKEGLHRSLALVYTRLNSTAMAAEHERIADELKRKRSKR